MRRDRVAYIEQFCNHDVLNGLNFMGITRVEKTIYLSFTPAPRIVTHGAFIIIWYDILMEINCFNYFAITIVI